MKKIAVLVEDGYQVLEVWYPYFRLREEGFETVFVGPGRQKEYRSKEWYPVPEELSIGNAKVADFDGVIIPGGHAPDMMRREPQNERICKSDVSRKANSSQPYVTQARCLSLPAY